MWNLLRFVSFGFGFILLITSGWLSWVRVQEPESPRILLINIINQSYAELIRVNTDGSGIRNLTSTDKFYTVARARWSHDGTTVYFNGVQDRNYPVGQFYQIKLNGMGLQNISPPDLYSIYYAYHSFKGDIYIIGQTETQTEFTVYRYRTETKQLDMVADFEGYEYTLILSPDGKWLLIWADEGWYRVRSDGSQLAALPDCLHHVTVYSWSPNSRYLPCTYIREGITHLSLLNIETLEITLIKQFENQIHYLSWSPDGEWLVFTLAEQSQRREIYKIRPNGSELTRLTYTESIGETMPTWSPDGQWIAFLQIRSRSELKYSLYKIRTDGSNKQWLGDFELVEASPLWSPIIDYDWHDKNLLEVGGALLLLSLLPIKKSLW